MGPHLAERAAYDTVVPSNQSWRRFAPKLFSGVPSSFERLKAAVASAFGFTMDPAGFTHLIGLSSPPTRGGTKLWENRAPCRLHFAPRDELPEVDIALDCRSPLGQQFSWGACVFA